MPQRRKEKTRVVGLALEDGEAHKNICFTLLIAVALDLYAYSVLFI